MALKSILLHLDRDRRNDARARMAIDLAARHQAHLIGLFAYSEPLHYGLAPAEASLMQEIIDRAEKEALEAGKVLRAEFEIAAAAAGLSFEWHYEAGDTYAELVRHAYHSDLVVLGQFDPKEANPFVSPTLADDVVMAASCPVLVVPSSGASEGVGRKVMVAWNGSRESSRSVRDAMPILESADRVVVYCVDPPGAGQRSGSEIATHLARHGVSVEGARTVDDGTEVGQALLAAAADRAIDLLVMGAYGHTRIREYLLGGVTRAILRHMTVPILLSH
jgi:nucleotide-binding universal stress UspA family protein